MEAFWAITLSILIIRWYWKNMDKDPIDESRRNTVRNRKNRPVTDEEIVTVVLPTITNDK